MASITLRRPAAADGPALIAAIRQSRGYHHPWVQGFEDEAGFEAWRERANSDVHPGFAAWIGEAPIGIINISNIIRGAFQNAFLGYYGMVSHARTGAMTEALRQAVRLGFEDLGLHRLEANIQPGNTASIALVKRLGFRLEGFSPRYLQIDGDWRDHQRWAILADDPRP